jgi:hypothetical protein
MIGRVKGSSSRLYSPQGRNENMVGHAINENISGGGEMSFDSAHVRVEDEVPVSRDNYKLL